MKLSKQTKDKIRALPIISVGMRPNLGPHCLKGLVVTSL